MKLEPIFTVKEKKLYKLADNSVVDISRLQKIEIKWSSVEIEDESYNEEFLASLREQLKVFDDAGKFAILIPVVDKPLETPEQIELFNNAFNHTARRIKDCVSVAGFAIPQQISEKGFDDNSPAVTFMELLAIKHSQYVYFTSLKNAPSNVALID